MTNLLLLYPRQSLGCQPQPLNFLGLTEIFFVYVIGETSYVTLINIYFELKSVVLELLEIEIVWFKIIDMPIRCSNSVHNLIPLSILQLLPLFNTPEVLRDYLI